MSEQRRGQGFFDLDVYQQAYRAGLMVIQEVLPRLPKEERFDLCDQLRRSAKAVPRLIAEAYSKRCQKRGFQSLLADATEESNETIVSLSQAKDLYRVDPTLCMRLIEVYDKTSRQLQHLSLAWSTFEPRRAVHDAETHTADETPTPTKPIMVPHGTRRCHGDGSRHEAP